MKNILIWVTIISCLIGCKKREYVHDNSFCIYKNYIVADPIPYNVNAITNPVNNSKVYSSNVLYLNAYNFIQNKNISNSRIQDSLYQFLCKEYLKCNAEYQMNRFGIDDNMRELMLRVPKNGCFYYCGQLLLQKSVQSLIFLQTDNVNRFNYCDLVLFNIKDKKIRSIINLSKYCNEEKKEDLSLKTYLINNSSFISVLIPIGIDYTEYEWCLIKKNKKIDFERYNRSKKLSPFRYSAFEIDSNGFVLLKPTDIKITNINILDKEGQVRILNGI